MNDPRQSPTPLDEQTVAALRRGRAVLNQAQIDIQTAQQCGMDCRGEQASCDAMCQRIDALLHHYAGEKKSR